jgi:hypothetical protein
MDQFDRPGDDGSPHETNRRLGWLPAFAFWIAVSIAGWALVVGAVSLLTPEQKGQIAKEGEDTDVAKDEDLDIITAAGPKEKKEQQEQQEPGQQKTE